MKLNDNTSNKSGTLAFRRFKYKFNCSNCLTQQLSVRNNEGESSELCLFSMHLRSFTSLQHKVRNDLWHCRHTAYVFNQCSLNIVMPSITVQTLRLLLLYKHHPESLPWKDTAGWWDYIHHHITVSGFLVTETFSHEDFPVITHTTET